MKLPSPFRLLRLNPESNDDRNAYYLVVEVFFAAILGAAATFNGAFALRLGATNQDIGLLTSLPSLLAVLISIPVGRFLQTRARRKPWIVYSLLAHRAGFLLVALVPFLKLLGLNVNSGTLVVAVLILISTPAHFFNVGWIPMLADVVPVERRSAVFAGRNITANATTSVFVFLFGQWLNQTEFPINYQIMYVFGFAVSLLSQYLILKVNIPEKIPTVMPAAKFVGNPIRVQIESIRKAMHDEPNFQRITTNTLMHGVGLWLASPLYILYYVRQLDASDAWLGLQGTVLTTMTILGWLFWRWVIVRVGEPRILKLMIVTIGLVPILVGLLPNLTLILFVVGLNGLLGPAVNLSHFNILLKVMPEDQRPVYHRDVLHHRQPGGVCLPADRGLGGGMGRDRSRADRLRGAVDPGLDILLVAADTGVDFNLPPPLPSREGELDKFKEVSGAYAPPTSLKFPSSPFP